MRNILVLIFITNLNAASIHKINNKMDDVEVEQYKPTEPITETMYIRINYANIDLHKWYYLSTEHIEYIVRPFIINEHGITFGITQMLDRDEPNPDWVSIACIFTLTPEDIDGDSIKVYNYVSAN